MNLRFFCLFFILCNISRAQIPKKYERTALAEKIYLQLNSDVFTTDNIIWFKAILANSTTHSLEITSGVLYVDLINSNKEIVESKLIKIEKGIGKGHFDLDRSYTEGIYQVRAYTEWNKNFGKDFFTEKYIKVFSELEKNEKNKELKIQHEEYFITKVSDSIILKFFPEGGKLVNGLSSVIGFKATNIHGKGISVKGEIIDENNKRITEFNSNRLGLGAFELNKIEKHKTYRAKLENNENIFSYQLPEIKSVGYTLSVKKLKNVILAAVNSNQDLNQKVKVSASVRGKTYYNQLAELIDGRYIFTIPKILFPEGIIVFKLEDTNSTPIAERLYFNEHDDNRLDIETKINNTNFNPRDKIPLNIYMSSKKRKQTKANISVLVFNKNLYGNFESKRQNILSYFLLNSDLKGEIEEPSSYFQKDSDLNIDYLMLTHGWRNYKFKKNSSKIPYAMESGLRIKGVINTKNKREKTKNLDILLLTFGDDSSIYSGKIKVPGSFDFAIEDLYGGQKDMILKPSGLSEKESNNYNFSIVKNSKPKINFKDFEVRKKVVKDSFVKTIVESNRLQKQIENKYYTNIDGVNQLDEVIIDAYKMTPKRKEMFEKYGAPDVVIDGRDIKDKKPDWSYGLLSTLKSEFSDKILVKRGRDNRLLAETLKGGKGHVNFYIVDGRPLKIYEYYLLENIVEEEVTSVEIIDDAKKMKDLTAYVNDTIPPTGLLYGSVIAVYTKSGKGLYGALKRNKNDVNVEVIDVFAIEKEFYIPSYDDTSRNFLEPDLRSTIYWNPIVKTQTNRTITIEFNHSDNTGDFLAVIEAVTEDGKLGYKTIEYSVNKTND